MLILIDARMYGLENAGIGRYIINLVEGISKVGKGDNFVIFLRKKYFKELKLPSNWKKVLADFHHYTIEEQIKLPWLISIEKPDIVHFPHLNTPLFWRGKYVVTIHDLTMHKQKTDATTLPLPIYYLKRIPYLINSRNTVYSALKIIVPAESVKDEITNYYKELSTKKIKTIYEGFADYRNSSKNINSQLILEKYNLKKPYFIYIGNAYPHKNLEAAIKAIGLINKEGNHSFLAIGGSRSVFTDRLKQSIGKEKAGEFVKLIGYVEDGDLSTLYKESVGFIYPSYAEGYGLQGVETMSSGSLVLASDIPVFKEVYGNHALYFDPYNIKTIAEQMKTALRMPSGLRNMRIKESKTFIKKYSWRKMAEETYKVYRSATNK